MLYLQGQNNYTGTCHMIFLLSYRKEYAHLSGYGSNTEIFLKGYATKGSINISERV